MSNEDLPVGTRVTIAVAGSRFDGRTGTIESAQATSRLRGGPRHYGVRVDGDENSPWGEKTPAFTRDELLVSTGPESSSLSLR